MQQGEPQGAHEQCWHDELIARMLDDEDAYPYGVLLTMQGWPATDSSQMQYMVTDHGTNVYIIPLKLVKGHRVAAIIAMGVLNLTPIFGVMGFQLDECVVGFMEFPLETRMRLQMCPSFQDTLIMFDTEILPHLQAYSLQKEE